MNTPSQIFLTNKHDGIVRRLKPNQEPTFDLRTLGDGRIGLSYRGVLQTSSNLEAWQDLVPQPATPWEFTPEDPTRFFRSICR